MKADLVLPPTIPQLLMESVRRNPEGQALVFPDQTWTYAELWETAKLRARALNSAGLASGMHLGLAMRDDPELIALLLGAMLAGVTAILLPPDIDEAEVSARLQTLHLDLFIGSALSGRIFMAALRQAEAKAGQEPIAAMHVDDPEYREFIGRAANSAFDPEAAALLVQSAMIAIVAVTSGVTGERKHCWLSHENLLTKSGSVIRCLQMTASTRIWVGVNMFQVGFIEPLLAAIACGAAIVATPGLDVEQARWQLVHEKVTHAYPIYLGNWLPIVTSPAALPSDFFSLAFVAMLGPISALRRAQRALPQAVILNMYGGAELGGSICMPLADDPADIRLGSSGKPFPGHEIRIVEPRRGTIMGPRSVGEIQVRGIGIPTPRGDGRFSSRFTEDGWLRTSDFGYLEKTGNLVFRGRLSEMLQIGEEAVSALDIETVLAAHRDVALVQVIGRPDENLGEVAEAFVELRPSASTSIEGLLHFCKERLPASHVPRYWRIMTEWPVKSSKISKPILASYPTGEEPLA